MMNPTTQSSRRMPAFGRRAAAVLVLTLVGVGTPRDASAQLDPLLFIKNRPNVLIAVDTSNRMQRDTSDHYRDANIYTKTGAVWEPSIGIDLLSPATKYYRKYINLQHTDPAVSGGDKFTATRIEAVTNLEGATFTNFLERTRLAIARRSLIEAITQNNGTARFGLLKMRQTNPRLGVEKNEGPVKVADAGQQASTESGGNGKWKITRPEVDTVNASIAGPVAPVVAPDAANATTNILNTLALNVGQAGALTPGGRDAMNITDAPLDNLLDDLKTEALRLINADTQCRNTVVVLVVGGGEGQTSGEDVAAKAAQFVNISGARNVPIYVIAIAPAAADVAQLRAIATNSGGLYTEITAAMVNAVTAGQPVPEMVRAINYAISHAHAEPTHFDTDPTVALPNGPVTEHQVTSPIIGTVNLEGALDINGAPLPNDAIVNPKTLKPIPQRSNLLVTTAFTLPGFKASLRAIRVYKPVADDTKPSGFKFVADGTRLWTASTPAAASRNIYTALPDGTMVAFTAANAAVLSPYLRTTNAAALIDYVRAQPLGAVVGSTPAVMDPPSLDPPPDSDYPAFASANKDRRSILWVGANDGMLHAIDARLGVEVWAYIPFNLLPKLKTLPFGQPAANFRYFVDSSPKVADVKIGGNWRTYLIIGEGAGGTFYQTFDVTLPNMGLAVSPTSNDINQVLAYFSDITKVPLKWAFPRYSEFDHTLAPWGDIAAGAPLVSKTVGQTWSDPAVGQIQNATGKYAVLTGSGPLPFTTEQAPNRGGTKAGTTFYMLNAETGDVFDSRDVSNDALAENVDNCAAVNDCTKMKNALQADPVATGPPDSRFIDKTYVGDLDGRLWRFDIGLDVALVPKVQNLVKLYDAGPSHPLFSSMATVNVGGTKQYLFQGTGSDLLPSNGVSQQYKLLVILDNGGSGTKTGEILLAKTDSLADDEKVTSFPAVAGDIVFFSTTSFKPATPCTPPDANLYAFTFIGGAAYDTNGDGRITNTDKPKVTTIAGARASAPFISDQHVVFAAGDKIEMFGDPEDFNNGVGQVGVRILSWREVR